MKSGALHHFVHTLFRKNFWCVAEKKLCGMNCPLLGGRCIERVSLFDFEADFYD